MQIKVASHAGFCFGVNRAINIVYKLLNKGKKVCTLGPIIHNPQMTTKMANMGVRTVSHSKEVKPDETLVIRSHGVSNLIIQTLKDLNIEFVDATCPFVAKIHSIVGKTHLSKDLVFIAGNENHPEVRGIIGHCKALYYVFNNSKKLLEIIKKLDVKNFSIILVAQTTFDVLEWEKCVKIIKYHFKNVSIFNTICNTTISRQNEAQKLSEISDAMIVIGGKNSSNTAKLFSICKKNCTTYFIETVNDLPIKKLHNAKIVGIVAGASTPANIIEEVKQRMENSEKNENVKPEEDANFEKMLEESLKNLNSAGKVKGVVVGIAPNEVYVDVGRKQAGFIPLNELTNDPTAKPEDIVSVGDELDLLIMQTNDQDGTIKLSKKRVDSVKGYDEIAKAYESGETLTGKIVRVVKGGVIAATKNTHVFIPASLAVAHRKDSLEDLKGQECSFKIIEVDPTKRRMIGSIKAVLNEQKQAMIDEFFDSLKVGDVIKGKVKSYVSYGVFVDLGPVDGLIHISELSWNRVKNPSEVLKIGEEINVTVKKIDKEHKKVSLKYRKDEDNPWKKLENKYPIGSVVDAKIVNITDFGAFANILPGIDGLIHVSQISDQRIDYPEDVLSIGDEVKVMITDIDFDNHRVSLSMRDVQDNY